LGLTADDILEKRTRDDARFERHPRRQQSRRFSSESSWSSESYDAMMDTVDTVDTVEQTVIPTGVEATKEAIAEQASPEMDVLSSPASAASPLFAMLSPELQSPATEMTPTTEVESDFVMTPEASWDWQAWEQYPNVMKLITSTQVVETPCGLESGELRWTDIALAA